MPSYAPAKPKPPRQYATTFNVDWRLRAFAAQVRLVRMQLQPKDQPAFDYLEKALFQLRAVEHDTHMTNRKAHAAFVIAQRMTLYALELSQPTIKHKPKPKPAPTSTPKPKIKSPARLKIEARAWAAKARAWADAQAEAKGG